MPGGAEAVGKAAQRLLDAAAGAAVRRRGARRVLGLQVRARVPGAEAGAEGAAAAGLRRRERPDGDVGPAAGRGVLLRPERAGGVRSQQLVIQIGDAGELLRGTAAAQQYPLRPPARVRVRRAPPGLPPRHRLRLGHPGLLRPRLPQAVLPRHPAVRDPRDDPEDTHPAHRTRADQRQRRRAGGHPGRERRERAREPAAGAAGDGGAPLLAAGLGGRRRRGGVRRQEPQRQQQLRDARVPAQPQLVQHVTKVPAGGPVQPRQVGPRQEGAPGHAVGGHIQEQTEVRQQGQGRPVLIIASLHQSAASAASGRCCC